MAKKKVTGNPDTVERSFFGSKDDRPEDRSVTSRRRVHDQLESQVEAFLAHGGAISHIDPHVTADNEQSAGAAYGSRPI